MPKGKYLSNDEILDALDKCKGIIRDACKLLNITEAALYNRVSRSEVLKEANKKIREKHGIYITCGNKGTKYYARTDDEIIEAINACNGITYDAADMLGMSKTNLQTRIRKNPNLKQVQTEARKQLALYAESKLKKKLDEEEWKAIEFTLRTQGKDIGYGSEQTINMNGQISSMSINFDVTLLPLEDRQKLYEYLTRIKQPIND